jgi:hydrogenase-4 component B
MIPGGGRLGLPETLLVAIALQGLAALLALSARRGAEYASASLSVTGSILGGAVALLAIGSSRAEAFTLPWSVPGGAIVLLIDPLSAFFLVLIFGISALGSVYGLAYWPRADHPRTAGRLRCFFSLMTVGLALVVTAAHAIFFLVAWELMALSAFFLVCADDETAAVRRAAWIYLVATHVGTACLFAAFALLRSATGTYLMQPLPSAGSSSAIFLLALVGFGLKAGIVPLHFWLPAAHANAPSHVSALMSGVMLKAGIYGILRFSSVAGTPPLWWGLVLAALGAVSAVCGISLASGQKDLKRALAYSSIENVGIICLGLGLALAGRALGRPLWVALGLTGSLFHVWSHGSFKSLLFFASGNVAHAAHSRDLDRLGGLLRGMPFTGKFFMIGAVAAAGLPLLNGFIGEWLIALGLADTVRQGTVSGWSLAFGLPALALAGALAVASFARLFGTVFLGQARSEEARSAREVSPLMNVPMATLALLCVLIGLWPTMILRPVLAAGAVWLGTPVEAAPIEANLLALLPPYAALGLVILALATVQSIFFRRMAQRPGTWDCGYAAPTPRMQYSSSFGAWISGLLPRFLAPVSEVAIARGSFPAAASFETHAPDPFETRVYEPLVLRLARRFERVRWLQQGRLTLYLVYIFLTTVAALVWALAWPYLR